MKSLKSYSLICLVFLLGACFLIEKESIQYSAEAEVERESTELEGFESSYASLFGGSHIESGGSGEDRAAPVFADLEHWEYLASVVSAVAFRSLEKSVLARRSPLYLLYCNLKLPSC
ncbi:MAG: hypothetical protein L3J39_11105 [Verrucomicrobiales bacterium]|nr:hypothetical protein [Verrucomicrobiales bacterium]